MKRIVPLCIAFLAGFLTYGILDRVITAQHDAKFRAEVTRCQLVLSEFGRGETDLRSGVGAECYTVVTQMNQAAPEPVRAFCTPEHHQGRGANVLYSSGEVRWLDAEDFDRLKVQLGPSGPDRENRKQR